MMQIEPMLLTEVDDANILNDSTKIFQEKHNGTRAIIHVKDHKIVGIRGRSNNPLLYCFPEFKDVVLPFSTAILDGEVCVFYDDKSIFYGGVDKRRSIPSDKVVKDYPATIVVFDVIQMEQDVLVYRPYKDRLAALQKYEWGTLSSGARIVLVESTNDGKALWTKVLDENREGVVVKDPMGLYELGKRSKSFLKLKNYKFIDVKVEHVEANNKGTKIFGKVEVSGNVLDVECQVQNKHVSIGEVVNVKYLDIVGNRLVQPVFGG